MTTGEIFSKIAAHMIEGLMFHQQMANYYEFLGLEGYAQCHGYRYMEESCNFQMINCMLRFITLITKCLHQGNIYYAIIDLLALTKAIQICFAKIITKIFLIF